MKKILCVFLCVVMFCGLTVNAYSRTGSEFLSELYEKYPSANKERAMLKPEYKYISNISLTFYIVNGKAFVSYSVTSKTNGLTVKVRLQQQKAGLVWTDAGEEKVYNSDKQYITDSYSTAVKDSGTYRVIIEAKVSNEEKTTQVVYEYDKTKVCGDANEDGVIRANDARLILRFSARLENYTITQKKICDVDNNGLITAADARIALRLAAKLI